jgi:predicted dehydrogenase
MPRVRRAVPSSSLNAPSRRRFLQASAAAGAGFWVAGRSLGADGDPTKVAAPSERLNVGVVGVGHRGWANIGDLAGVNTANIVALCDVDDTFMAPAAKRFESAKTYKDFRVMLDQQKDLDAILVATPDHTHFHASLMAIQAGKHVYCEKPLTHTVWEARTLTDAARKAKRVTQMGTQIHAGDNYRRVVEAIRGGAIGSVKEVHVFMSGGWSAPNGRPTATPPVPSTLDYDLWLGPAEPWAYHPTYLPENWRSYWNFGNGKLGDMACHHVDLPFWALGLKYPTQVTPVEGPKPHPDGAPDWVTVRWDFAADTQPLDSSRPSRGPVSITWYGGDGDEHLPDAWDDWKLPEKWRVGNVFVGDKGILFADYNSYGLRPTDTFKDFKAPAPTIAKSVGHHREWVTACKAGDPTAPLCNFDYSGPLAETVLLGCAAYRAQAPLQWDAPNLRVTNTRDADRYLRREYRKGWEINA